jgi:hypothetical protein
MSFQFHIQLSGLKNPKVWREFLVNETMTFHKFHYVIQACMGWDNCHLYQFSPKGYNSLPSFELKTSNSDVEFSPISYLKKGYELTYDSSKVKLSDYFNTKSQKITYTYDFGDNWKHLITLKKIWPGPIDPPMLIAGEGKCPPEDCGGVWGYEALIEILNDPKHPEYEEMREWLAMEDSEVWEVNEFDIKGINQILKNFK